MGLLMPFWQTSYHFKQKKMKFVRSNPEQKQKNYNFFKNKCHSCKCFCGHVECSLDKPFHPINTFFASYSKINRWTSRKLKKVHFFQKHFFKNNFLLKNFLWTRRMQSRKTVQCFFSKAWKLFAENSKIDLKLKTFRWKKFPKSSSGHVSAVLTSLLTHCQKFEHSLLHVRNCLKSYICTKHWFFNKIFI